MRFPTFEYSCYDLPLTMSYTTVAPHSGQGIVGKVWTKNSADPKHVTKLMQSQQTLNNCLRNQHLLKIQPYMMQHDACGVCGEI